MFTVMTNQVGYIAQVARDVSKQTSSSGHALRLGPFTAINPWPCEDFLLRTDMEKFYFVLDNCNVII